MTTKKLIELAKYCIGQNPNNYISCKDCPYKKCDSCKEMLLSGVADRLEKAYIELKKQCSCASCEHFANCDEIGYDAICCSSGNMCELEGDEE